MRRAKTAAPDTYKVGQSVRHRDAGPNAPIGVVVKMAKACVGAPFMVRVQWPGCADPAWPMNARSLVTV